MNESTQKLWCAITSEHSKIVLQPIKKPLWLKCKWKSFECTICGRFFFSMWILWSPTWASAMNYVALMALIIVEIETLSDFLRKHNSIEIQCQATRLSPTIPEIIVQKWINLWQLSASYQKNIKRVDEKISSSHMPVMIYDIRKTQ